MNKKTEEGLKKGIEYFQQAIVKDPAQALAYDGVADSYITLGVLALIPPQEAFPKAKAAPLKALEIDDTLAEAHGSIAYIKTRYDWDWSGGEREFQRAIELKPSYAEAHWYYGMALMYAGRFEDAIAEEERALALDPVSPTINAILGCAFLHAKQYDQASNQLRKTLELDPHFIPAHLFLGMAYLQQSLVKEGIAEFEKALVISPSYPAALSGLGYAYAVVGRREEAQKVLDQLNEISKQKYVPAVSRAAIYVGLGEKDNAFEWLEKGYEDRSIGAIFLGIKVDPIYDPLRSDPRFADLLRRMNLQP